MAYGNFNLGNYANQLDLNDQNKAAQSLQQQQNVYPSNSDVSQAANQQSQQPSGWDTTSKYLSAAGSMGQEEGEQKNGLQKVLGLVGLFA